VAQAPDRHDAERLAADLAVLAEPHRLMVLAELRRGPRTAGWLAEATGMAPSLASHHLSVLLRAGMVARTREGSFVRYTASRERLAEVQQRLAAMLRPGRQRDSG
jgi:DNA-binding transcriptional ArsR family regulator